MLDRIVDGRLQVSAALSLIEGSGLLEWTPELGLFIPVDRDAFEFYCRKSIDPVFGRLTSWISFSVGAEFLAKGMCLVCGVEIREDREVPQYPTTQIEDWIPIFLVDSKRAGMMPATNFGTLGSLVHRDKKTQAPAGALVQLCQTVNADQRDRELILASYELLSRSIRNRDAHAYVPNTRDSHYHLVPELFASCFNKLVSWLPGGATTLNSWRAEAKAFVSTV